MGEKPKAEKKRLSCPYCDKEIADLAYPYCQACEVTVFYCPRCREPVPRENRLCPHCGAEIRAKDSP